MTHSNVQRLGKPICYVVIDPDCADCEIPIRHHQRVAQCASGQHFSAFQTRFSVGVIPSGGCVNGFDPAGYAQLRLAIDVIRDLGGYPQLVANAVAALWGLVALTGPRGGFNRVATELLHRMGANLGVRVRGPLVLHAAPDSRQHIGSLSDPLSRRLAEMTLQASRCIEGGNTGCGHIRPVISVKENLTPWSRPGHAAYMSSRRSHAAIAAAG